MKKKRKKTIDIEYLHAEHCLEHCLEHYLNIVDLFCFF